MNFKFDQSVEWIYQSTWLDLVKLEGNKSGNCAVFIKFCLLPAAFTSDRDTSHSAV